jgi:hypothetical protein
LEQILELLERLEQILVQTLVQTLGLFRPIAQTWVQILELVLLALTLLLY